MCPSLSGLVHTNVFMRRRCGPQITLDFLEILVRYLYRGFHFIEGLGRTRVRMALYCLHVKF